jgi:tetratricopeptide (TPR) repeat protein
MESHRKEWLVRTRAGDILGPYTQRELVESFQRGVLTAGDEIAPSGGRWTSAQALANHDLDEATRTSTRSVAFTRSTVPVSDVDSEEFTPTPDMEPLPRVVPIPQVPPPPPVAREPQSGSKLGPFVVLFAGLAAATFLLSYFKQQRPTDDRPTSGTLPAKLTGGLTGESPFAQQIFHLIHRGETQHALRLLTEHHERNKNPKDLEYLVPYAALLILEGESTQRAQKMLEQVLAAPVPPKWKARAHHWLGYLMLSQETGDMGEGHFLQSLQLNPKDPASRFNLGRAYLKQGRYSQALDYFQLAELEVPQLWLVHIYKGRARAELRNLEDARASFLTALALAPDRWMSYVYFALFQSNYLRDLSGAVATLRRMLTRDPHYEIHSPPPFGYFQERVNYAEYVSIYNELTREMPAEERKIGRLYLSYLMNGATGSEGRRLEAATEKGSLSAKIFGLKAALDRDAPQETIRILVDRVPPVLTDFGYYAFVLRGEARMRLGSFSEAQEDFRRALALEPHAAVAHWGMAVLLRKMQRSAESRAELRTLLSQHPEYIPAIVAEQSF